MANAKKKCKHKGCSKYVRIEDAIKFQGKIFCCDNCKTEFVIAFYQKKHVDAVKASKKEVKIKERVEKVKDKKRKDEFYANDVKYQHKLTQPIFNKMRVLEEKLWFKDNGLEPACISCGKPNMDWCCGHFKTRGSQGNLRYDRINTYLQCNRYCNMGLSGNINGNKTTRGYIKGLFERFGDDKANEIYDYCISNTQVKKWTGQELIDLRKGFSKKIKELELKLQC